MSGRALICADIGNSRTKVAVAGQTAGQWQTNQSVASPELLDLEQVPVADWMLISVNQIRLGQLRDWIADQRGDDRIRLLGYRDFPIELRVDFPEKLGIDRIAAAVGGRELTGNRKQPLFIVNVGTAVTIDYVDAQGVFEGGVIYPGPFTSFQSLARATDQLPELAASDFPAEVIGKNTTTAITAGVWQMQLGAMREVLKRYRERPLGVSAVEPVVLITGGGAGPLVKVYDQPLRHVPDLVLRGIHAAAEHLGRG
jgi:type III pantothenate kinase